VVSVLFREMINCEVHVMRVLFAVGGLRRIGFALLLAFPTIGVGPSIQSALAGIDVGQCSISNAVLEPQLDEKLESIAKARIDNGEWIILFNPFRSSLSSETERWLFFRQCALIQKSGTDTGNRAVTLPEHERADCRAVELMSRGKSRGRFELRSIQDDLDMADDEFWKRNLGGRRFIKLEDCAKSSKG
jgi:hypothetical protein